MRKIAFSYEPDTCTLYITRPGDLEPGRTFMLQNGEEVRMHSISMMYFWREECRGQRVYG